MRSLAGPHAASPSSLPLDDTYESLEPGDLRGLTIAWSPDFGLGVPVEREVVDVLSGGLHVFESLGARVEVDCPDFSDADEVFQTTRAFDFATNYGHLLGEHRHRMKDAVQWNVDKGMALTTPDFVSANAARSRLDAAVRSFFSRYDAFLAPAVQVLPFPATEEFPSKVDGVCLDNYLDWMRAACLVSATGLPALSVPGGFSSSGLPVGLQIVTADRADRLLLRIAHAFEASTGLHRRMPNLVTASV
jgi:amidase